MNAITTCRNWIPMQSNAPPEPLSRSSAISRSLFEMRCSTPACHSHPPPITISAMRPAGTSQRRQPAVVWAALTETDLGSCQRNGGVRRRSASGLLQFTQRSRALRYPARRAGFLQGETVTPTQHNRSATPRSAMAGCKESLRDERVAAASRMAPPLPLRSAAYEAHSASLDRRRRARRVARAGRGAARPERPPVLGRAAGLRAARHRLEAVCAAGPVDAAQAHGATDGVQRRAAGACTLVLAPVRHCAGRRFHGRAADRRRTDPLARSGRLAQLPRVESDPRLPPDGRAVEYLHGRNRSSRARRGGGAARARPAVAARCRARGRNVHDRRNDAPGHSDQVLAARRNASRHNNAPVCDPTPRGGLGTTLTLRVVYCRAHASAWEYANKTRPCSLLSPASIGRLCRAPVAPGCARTAAAWRARRSAPSAIGSTGGGRSRGSATRGRVCSS